MAAGGTRREGAEGAEGAQRGESGDGGEFLVLYKSLREGTTAQQGAASRGTGEGLELDFRRNFAVEALARAARGSG